MLDRAHITKASEIMLPAYPIFMGWIGCTWVLSSAEKIANSSMVLHVASGMLPIPVWGACFVVVSFIQMLALWQNRRVLYLVSLALMAGTMMVWSVVTVVTIFHQGGSPSAPAWPLLAMAAAIASARSLEAQERQ